MSRERFERRRQLQKEQDGLQDRAEPTLPDVRPSLLRWAKKTTHQGVRRTMHALLNVLPSKRRAEENTSAWLTTTTDEALAVSSRIRGAAEVRREQIIPTHDPLRARLAKVPADGQIAPPDDEVW